MSAVFFSQDYHCYISTFLILQLYIIACTPTVYHNHANTHIHTSANMFVNAEFCDVCHISHKGFTSTRLENLCLCLTANMDFIHTKKRYLPPTLSCEKGRVLKVQTVCSR